MIDFLTNCRLVIKVVGDGNRSSSRLSFPQCVHVHADFDWWFIREVSSFQSVRRQESGKLETNINCTNEIMIIALQYF